jgi:hypothetical protein
MTVQFSSFTGVGITNNIVQLDWSTLGEVNNDGFFMQRWVASIAAWEDLPNSFVAGSGTTSAPQQYNFREEDLSSRRRRASRPISHQEKPVISMPLPNGH